jgi:hypothetical protein
MEVESGTASHSENLISITSVLIFQRMKSPTGWEKYQASSVGTFHPLAP